MTAVNTALNKEETEKKLAIIDDQINAQLKLIQQLIKRRASAGEFKDEYTKVAEMFVDKQVVLEQILDIERGDLGPAEYEEQKQMIKDRIQTSVVKIAMIIDNAISDEEQPKSSAD